MANSKISALTSATTPLVGTETLPIVQSGATVKATVANITGAGAYAGAFTTLSATGVTTVQAGTALLPAITTSGDTNTGIFFPAADTIAFSEGGVEAMRLNANGQLNVGNTSTAFDSTAYAIVGSGTGDSGLVIYTSNATAGYLQFADGTSGAEEYRGFVKYDHSTNAMSFSTNSAARTDADMTINSSAIVTMSAYGAGAATFSAAGVISSVSDETWKIKDGVPIDTDSMLNKLEPGYWYYNDEKKETFGTDRQLGFYAQNVNAAIGPEAAPIPEEGKPWGYYDRSVLAITVISLQKALATIESLNDRIKALENK